MSIKTKIQWCDSAVNPTKQDRPAYPGPPHKQYTTDRAEMLKLREDALTRAVERNKESAVRLQEQLAEVKKLRS